MLAPLPESLQTARTGLAPLRPGDAAALFAYRSRPEVVVHQSWSPADEAEAAAFIRTHSLESRGGLGQWKQYGIYARPGGALLGDCGLHRRSGAEVEIGYTLAPAHQGQGLATEVVAALVEALRALPGVRTVLASTDPANRASHRVLEKNGFVRRRLERGSVRIRGRWCDDLLWTLDLGPVAAP